MTSDSQTQTTTHATQKNWIKLAFDPGSSLTKVIYQVSGDDLSEAKFLCMEPEVMELPISSIEMRDQIGMLTGENDAWLTNKKKDKTCQVVGQLARQFGTKPNLAPLKYEGILPKFLATVGAIVEKEKLSPQVEIKAAVLLPYGEFADREELEQQLSSQMKSFYFRGQRINGQLTNIKCFPEGGGFAWELRSEKGDEWFNHGIGIVLMLGHRNSSCLVFENGVLNQKRSATSDLGFARMLDLIIQQTSGQDRENLTRAVYEVGEDIKADHKLVRVMTRSKESANINREAQRLADAISTARQDYFRFFKDWFDPLCPQRINWLVIGGGCAYYFKPELSKYLHWTDPRWGEMPEEDFQNLVSWSEDSLRYRIVDVWKFFKSSFLPKVNDDDKA